MKKVLENRYPHSATLFRFCKEALEIRYEGKGKIIDQDVGAILGYDPADCSHWKKGKKNIRALSTLVTIAQKLNTDERLLVAIATGEMDLEEAIFEFRGYGSFQLSPGELEDLRKEFYNQTPHAQGKLGSFEQLYSVKRNQIAKLAQSIILASGIKEAPLYLPELSESIPDLTFKKISQAISYTFDEGYRSTFEDNKLKVEYANMRPFLRFSIARDIYGHLCEIGYSGTEGLASRPSCIKPIEANVFAAHLLIPDYLLADEIAKVDISGDLVAQLAQKFWVSHAFMSQRLVDYHQVTN